jgi:hypothetical protein
MVPKNTNFTLLRHCKQGLADEDVDLIEDVDSEDEAASGTDDPSGKAAPQEEGLSAAYAHACKQQSTCPPELHSRQLSDSKDANAAGSCSTAPALARVRPCCPVHLPSWGVE